MIHQQQQHSDTKIHKGGSNLSPATALVSGNALSSLLCELMKRYWQIVKSPNHNPYYLSKKEENISIVTKIKELENIAKHSTANNSQKNEYSKDNKTNKT